MLIHIACYKNYKHISENLCLNIIAFSSNALTIYAVSVQGYTLT